MKIKEKLREKLSEVSSLMIVVFVLLVEIVYFAVTNKYFFNINNFLNIGLYAAIIGCVSCSVTFINISGMIDISVGSQIAVAGMVSAVVLEKGLPWYVAVIGALVAGALCGAVNGFFVTKLKLNAFITTIATMQIFRGVAYLLTNGMSLAIADEQFKFIGRGYILGLPMSMLIMIVSFIIFHLISKYTVFGRNIYMIGGNAQASFLSGIKVNDIRFKLYLLNGFMSGLSGALMSAQTGSGIPSAAASYNMTALSAVILGGAALTGGKGTIFGTFLGSMVLAILTNGMTMNGMGAYWQEISIGLVLILAVSIDAIKGGSLKRKI